MGENQGVGLQSSKGLTDAEQAAVQKRREQATLSADQPLLALAFSGGGIRSATICLGLLRALARNNNLKKFDFLSTVSGGGYIGSAFGRLFDSQHKADEVQEGLKKDNSVFLWWLRQNGRYLTPTGFVDRLEVGANYLRGMLSLHFELAMMVMLLGSVIALPHVTWLYVLEVLPDMFRWEYFFSSFVNPWWFAAAIISVFMLVVIFAFWQSGEATTKPVKESGRLIIAVGLFLGSLWLLKLAGWHGGESDALTFYEIPGSAFVLLPIIVLTCYSLAMFLRFVILTMTNDSGVQQRVRYTRWLTVLLSVFLVNVLLGVLDILSWTVANYLGYEEDKFQLLLEWAAALLVIILISRAAEPRITPFLRGKKSLSQLTNLAGLLVLFGLLLLWLSIFQLIVFSPGELASETLVPLPLDSRFRWLIITIPVVLYLIASGRNQDNMNRSSLHDFYRSRLMRAYTSVGGYGESDGVKRRFPVHTLSDYQSPMGEKITRITTLLESDDVELKRYKPHMHGGPLHLINSCINLSVDDRTGAYNADRQGIALAVSAAGVEVGRAPPTQLELSKGSTLSRWIAISGAAISTGMGSNTRPGIAALTFMMGLRLGFWHRGMHPRPVRNLINPVLLKYKALMAELFGRFPGLRSSLWYLSDGGHFDNTGVLSLLKRRPHVIVMADCGADPDYLFADLEHLIRKARIDLYTSIEIIDPETVSYDGFGDGEKCLFGTPDSINARPGNAYLIMARVTYPNGDKGALLVVKPRRLSQLPLDVAGYSDRDASFPQQTTGDQFFDEAQWESYCRLGLELGSVVTDEMLGLLPDWVESGRPVGAADVARVDEKVPQTRRGRFGVFAAQSISIGALVTVFIAGWQAWSVHLDSQGQRERELLKVSDAITQSMHDEATTVDTVYSKLESLPSYARGLLDKSLYKAVSIDLNRHFHDFCLKNAEGEVDGCAEKTELLRTRDQNKFITFLNNYWTHKPDTTNEQGETGLVLLAAAAGLGAKRESGEQVTSQSQMSENELDLQQDIKACGMTDIKRRLFIHVYDESSRVLAESAGRVTRSLGVQVKGIENVIATAERKGKNRPYMWSSSVLLYRPGDKACAKALSEHMSADIRGVKEVEAKPLPGSLSGRAGNMELWIAPEYFRKMNWIVVFGGFHALDGAQKELDRFGGLRIDGAKSKILKREGLYRPVSEFESYSSAQAGLKAIKKKIDPKAYLRAIQDWCLSPQLMSSSTGEVFECAEVNE